MRGPADWLARRWSPVALLGVVLAVTFGFLSMHDLVRPMSVEHLMASASQVSTDVRGPATAAGTGTTEAGMTNAPPSDGELSDGEPSKGGASEVATVTVAGPALGAQDTGDCASCGQHPSAMALCILALSMLLLVWRAPTLRARLAPPTAAFYGPSWVSAPRQPRPPTQAELSVCRT